MTFQKYNTTNRAVGQLLANISASDTLLQLQASQGSKFPSENAILTIVQYATENDPDSEIIKEEDIYMTSRSTDSMNITRGFGDTTGTAFEAGDFVYLNVMSEHISDIQNEVERLGNDKLDTSSYNSSLRNNLANWKTHFTNGSGEETELALGSSGRVLYSNGTSTAPSWEVPTTNITGLDTRTTPDMDTDEFVVGGDPNEKVTLSQYRASSSEVSSGTREDKFVSPKDVKDYYDMTISVSPSNDTKSLLLSERESLFEDADYVKVREIEMPYFGETGSVRISIDIRFEWDDTSGQQFPECIIVRNGEVTSGGGSFSSDYSISIGGNSTDNSIYNTFSINIPDVSSRDKIGVILKTGRDNYGFTGGDVYNHVYIKNFLLQYNEVKYSNNNTPVALL